MAFAAADITNITGVTYSATTSPTTTEVALFVTGAKGLWTRAAFAAPDETDASVINMLACIAADLISNFKRDKMLNTPNSVAGEVPAYRDPMPSSRAAEIRVLVTTESDPSGSSFEFAW
jgi:hypothetical protein